jgi:hypothetical protein
VNFEKGASRAILFAAGAHLLVVAAALACNEARAQPGPSGKDRAESKQQKDEGGRKSKPPSKREEPEKLAGKVAVLNAGPVSSTSVGQLLRLYQALESGRLGQPISDRALRETLAGKPANPALLKAKSSLDKGKALYGALKLEEAVKSLRRAETLYLEHVATARSRRGLRDTWAYLLLALSSLGQQKEMKEVAGRLRLLTKPGKAPAGVPASLWKKISARLPKKTKTRGLAIEAPSSAKVWVDFKPVSLPAGEPPKEEKGSGASLRRLRVDGGEHHVAVEAAGHRKLYRRVEPGRDSQSITAVLAPESAPPHLRLRRKLAKIRESRAGFTAAASSTIASSLEIARLIVASPAGKGWSLRAFDSKTGTFVSPPLAISFPVEAADLARLKGWSVKLADKLSPKKKEARAADEKTKPRKLPLKESARKAAAKVAEPKSPAEKGKEKKKPKPLWKRWYFWVAIGAVGIVTAVFALRKEETDKVEIEVYRP